MSMWSALSQRHHSNWESGERSCQHRTIVKIINGTSWCKRKRIDGDARITRRAAIACQTRFLRLCSHPPHIAKHRWLFQSYVRFYKYCPIARKGRRWLDPGRRLSGHSRRPRRIPLAGHKFWQWRDKAKDRGSSIARSSGQPWHSFPKPGCKVPSAGTRRNC